MSSEKNNEMSVEEFILEVNSLLNIFHISSLKDNQEGSLESRLKTERNIQQLKQRMIDFMDREFGGK